MAGVVLNKSMSLMLFQHKSYKPVHVNVMGFLYILLHYFLKLFILQGRKL